MDTQILKWIQSINFETFEKAIFSKYRGPDPSIKTVNYRKIKIKNHWVIKAVSSHATHDITQNIDWDTFWAQLNEAIADHIYSHINYYSTHHHTALRRAKKKWILGQSKIMDSQSSSDYSHDQSKHYKIPKDAKFLHKLGIVDAHAQLYKDTKDKYKQIERFIDILSPCISPLSHIDHPTIVDMGSGKGYLTFALYHYLDQMLDKPFHIYGVELREHLVNQSNIIAQQLQYLNLRFVQGSILDYKADRIDMIIALHACDTATDDAIMLGLKHNARWIVVAPCCHKQVRKSIIKSKANLHLIPMLNFGLYLERQAEMLTDMIRILTLQYFGYKCKVIDFVDASHSPKNVMILAEKHQTSQHIQSQAISQISHLMTLYGLDSHYLLDHTFILNPTT